MGARAQRYFVLSVLGALTSMACSDDERETFADASASADAATESPRDAGLDTGSDSGADATTRSGRPDYADVPGVPPEVVQFADEWPLPGRDYENSRYTTDSSITSDNVDRLQEAWRVELPGLSVAFGKCSTAPLIAGGMVYFQDLAGMVWAVDLVSGSIEWQAGQAGLSVGPNGVALGWGKVFAIGGSDAVVAYDAATGTELWAQSVIDTPTAGIDIQPTVFDDMVLVSTVPISINGIYVPGDRGTLKALAQDTGAELWRFDTIASADDVWSNSDVNSGGGSWFPPSIDVERGHVFWAVANPAPFPGTLDFPNGSSRPGDNLFTDSTVALDVRTGDYQWHHQTIQHDLFDRDLIHTMLTEVDGEPAVVSTGKEGHVWAYARDTGDVLWGPVDVGVHENDDLTELTGPTAVLPGSFGGVLTPPALADGVIYAAALNAATMYRPDQTAYFGSQLGTRDGSLVAIEAATGTILWDAPVGGDPTGGVTVVNDLVITATFQGTLFAYQRDTGEEVWRWDAPAGINAWPSVVGDTIVVPVGIANPAVVVALRIDG